MLRKLYAGDRLHKTRLHDEKGNFAGWANVLRDGPTAVATGFMRIGLGYRPELPWIAYSAIRRLRRFLTPQSRVLEFGSGMSTLWYAKRAGTVCAVEDNREWYEKIDKVIRGKNLANVTYRLADNENDYSAFLNDDAAGFDLIMVDGSWRSGCIAKSAHLLKPGGMLYLDDSDKDSEPHGGDMRLAEEHARTLAKDRGGRITLFTDFAPTQFFAQQGLMVEVP